MALRAISVSHFMFLIPYFTPITECVSYIHTQTYAHNQLYSYTRTKTDKCTQPHTDGDHHKDIAEHAHKHTPEKSRTNIFTGKHKHKKMHTKTHTQTNET